MNKAQVSPVDWSDDNYQELLRRMGDVAGATSQDLIMQALFGENAATATNFTSETLLADAPAVGDEDFASDDVYLSHMSHEKKMSVLDAAKSESMHGWGSGRLSDDFGGPQMWIDNHAKRTVHDDIHNIDPNIRCVGEEATELEWAGSKDVSEGEVVAVLDVLDGSVPYQIAGVGWNVVIMVYVSMNGRLKLVGVVISDCRRAVYTANLLTREATVQYNGSTSVLTNPDRKLGAANPWMLSAVAASGQDAKLLGPLRRERGGWGYRPKPHGGKVDWDPQPSICTLGGNPLAVHMSVGGLAYLVQSRWTTVFDAAALVFMLLQPGQFEFYTLSSQHPREIGSRHPQPVSADTILAMFDDVNPPPTTTAGQARSGRGTYRPIEPLLVTRSGDHDLIGAGFDSPDDPHYPDHTPGERVVHRLVAELRFHFKRQQL